jgi:hypothetical protein
MIDWIAQSVGCILSLTGIYFNVKMKRICFFDLVSGKSHLDSA